jgi:hypothetical protein
VLPDKVGWYIGIMPIIGIIEFKNGLFPKEF